MKNTSSVDNHYQPESVPHPGVDLAEQLEFVGWTIDELASRVEASSEALLLIISGASPITPQLANALQETFGVPSHFWLTRQARFDSFHTRH